MHVTSHLTMGINEQATGQRVIPEQATDSDVIGPWRGRTTTATKERDL
jgi:hypothetical protein